MEYPNLYRIRQRLNDEKITDIEGAVHDELSKSGLRDTIKPGSEIAITAGSRGIANLAAIVKATCDFVKGCGAIPFVVPSMGSHGGATAEGQTAVLEKYGITPGTMDCEIRSSMEVELLGYASNGAPVYMDRNALHSDGIISLNRVKPHTDFIGEIESGVIKMLTVGLGKEKGATSMHGYDLGTTIPLAFEVVLQKAPIIAGLAIVENSKDETFVIKGVKPADFVRVEKELLALAKEQVPHLPCDKIDVLVVKEMGKAYSGTGMDTKVIGRIMISGIPEPEYPRVNKLVVLRMAKSSYGNALGVGLADITTKELVDSIDFQATHSNIIPTTYLERGKIPLFFDTEERAIEVAFLTLGNIPRQDAKVVIIENTLHLDEMIVSQSVLDSLTGVEIVNNNVHFKYDASGKLCI